MSGRRGPALWIGARHRHRHGELGLAGFLGIRTLFLAAPGLYLALKLIGAAYLAWLGIQLLRKSLKPAGSPVGGGGLSGRGPWGAYRVGLLTNLTNPKAAAFTTSLFAATLPPDPPLSLGLIVIPMMAAISGGWYVVVVLLFATRRMQAFYLRAGRWIDRVAGGAFLLLGARLGLGD